jgi:hypothetical protein
MKKQTGKGLCGESLLFGGVFRVKDKTTKMNIGPFSIIVIVIRISYENTSPN